MDGAALLAALGGSAAAAKRNPKEEEEAKVSSLSGAEEWVQFNGILDSFPLRGPEVNVVPHSSGDHDRGSSKLKLKNLVNFGWQHSYHHGQLLTTPPPASPMAQLLAYAIVTPGKREGVVRVAHRKTGERTLLKGMTGKVKDLAFASIAGSESILGCVDEVGNLFVFSIRENPDNHTLKTDLVLQVKREKSLSAGDPDDIHRIIWCPYLPDEEEEDQQQEEDDPSPAKLLVLTHNNVAEMLNVEMIVSQYGSGAVLSLSDVKVGRRTIDDHSGAIVDATFSPDGTALATASADGQVKFFQVYMHGLEAAPRCLHEWAPHGGRPLSSLFFLDDHRNHQPEEQFWKFAITSADHNSELKLWSCETWTCLQTIRFHQPKSEETGKTSVVLKATLDQSAKFLVLSDIWRKNVYVLQLAETAEGVRVGSVSEFSTPSAFLSMVVTSAGLTRRTGQKESRRRRKNQKEGGGVGGGGGHFGGIESSSDGDLSDSNDGLSDVTSSGADSDDELTDDDSGGRSPSCPPPGEDDDAAAAVAASSSGAAATTIIDMILVQPKSLQECRIVYEDALQTMPPTTLPVAKTEAGATVKEEGEGEARVVALGNGNRNKEAGTNGIKTEPVEVKEVSATVQQRPIKVEPLSPPASSEASAKSELKAAADKITLMSPEAFAAKKQQPATQVKEEVQIKKEPLEEEPSGSGGRGRPVGNVNGGKGIRARSDGSSPSREVQDILGDSEEQGGLGAEIVVTEEPYDDDDLVDIDEEEDDDGDGGGGGGGGDENLFASAAKAALNLTDPGRGASETKADAATSLNKSAGWPAAPPVKKELPEPLASQQQHRQDEFKQRLPAASLEGDTSGGGGGSHQSAGTGQLMRKMDDMMRLIQSQQKEIKTLRDEMKALKKSSGDSQQQLLDKFVKRSGQQLHDVLRKESKSREAEAAKVEQAMAQEMRRVAPQASQELAKTVSSLLEVDLRQRTGRADAALRDAVSRLAHPKALPEQLAHTVAQSLQQALQQELRDSVGNVLVPATERAMQNMLQQVSAKVTQGVKEHEAKLQAHMGQLRQEMQLKLLDPLYKSVHEQLAQAGRLSDTQLDKLVAAVRETLAREMSKAAAASPANMPQSPMGQVMGSQPSLEEMKQTIRRHLHLQRYEEAFQVALSANSLSLVLATCEMVNPAAIFNQAADGSASVLPQPVLLALVQQLSHDLDDKTDVKHRYLEEALMSLDSSDPTTRQHLGTVLSGLASQLRKYLAGAGSTAASAVMIKQMKMLQLATDSLLRAAT